MAVNLITTTFPCPDVSEETQRAEVLATEFPVNLADLGHAVLHGF